MHVATHHMNLGPWFALREFFDRAQRVIFLNDLARPLAIGEGLAVEAVLALTCYLDGRMCYPFGGCGGDLDEKNLSAMAALTVSMYLPTRTSSTD